MDVPYVIGVGPDMEHELARRIEDARGNDIPVADQGGVSLCVDVVLLFLNAGQALGQPIERLGPALLVEGLIVLAGLFDTAVFHRDLGLAVMFLEGGDHERFFRQPRGGSTMLPSSSEKKSEKTSRSGSTIS